MKRPRNIGLVVSTFMAVAVALLLPHLSIAGSLEPTPDAVDTSGNPVPTMKTLDQIPPTWSQKLPANDGPNGDSCNSSRFKCVFDGQAVLDKETGLVWDRYPCWNESDWFYAIEFCIKKKVDGRAGWRLPSIEELQSLGDVTKSEWVLPDGHPFSCVDSLGYWSATTSASDTTRAWNMSFFDNTMDVWFKTGVSLGRCAWCVRGVRGLILSDWVIGYLKRYEKEKIFGSYRESVTNL